MAKMTTEELLSIFEEMSVLELKEFLDAFEEKFDVTAAAPVAVAAAPAGGGDGGGSDEEKDSFNVVLADAGGQKIQVIKEVRGLTSLGLKEAKEIQVSQPGIHLNGGFGWIAEKGCLSDTDSDLRQNKDKLTNLRDINQIVQRNFPV